MKKRLRKCKWSFDKCRSYITFLIIICLVHNFEMVKGRGAFYLNDENTHKYLLENVGTNDKISAANTFEYTVNTERITTMKFRPRKVNHHEPQPPTNLTGSLFWDEHFHIFRINLTWIPPPDLNNVIAYSLTYKCWPRCKSNEESAVEHLEKEESSVVVPNFEGNSEALDFISLGSQILFNLTVLSFNRDYLNNEAVLMYNVPECVNERCYCGHMNNLPTPNLTAEIDSMGFVNITWSTPNRILEKIDSKYQTIHVNITLFRMKAKKKIIVRNQTIVLKLEDMKVEHSMTLPNKFKLFDNYQVSLYMADVQGCRTLKEAIAIVKYLPGSNFRIIQPVSIFLAQIEPYIYYISGGILSLLVLTIMGIISFQQRKRLKRILYKNHGTSNSLGTNVPNIQIHTDTADGYFRLKRIRRPNVPLRPSPVYIGQSNELLNTQSIIADPLEIDIKRIKYITQIGQGEFGQVYRAFLSNKDFSNHYIVAVKTLKDNPSVYEKEEFMKEISIFKQVGYHPNIVRLIGYVTQIQPCCMVMEYLPKADLKQYLCKIKSNLLQNYLTNRNTPLRTPDHRQNRFNFSTTNIDRIAKYSTGSMLSVDSPLFPAARENSENRPSQTETEYILLSSDGSPMTPKSVIETPKVERLLDALELQKFALQIARGMSHLEQKNVVHRDLAARNILIDDHKNLKISDFGLSRTGTYVNFGTKSKLPFRWLSIEAMNERIFSNKSDVWSYAIVLWEIGTLGEVPYSDLKDYVEIMAFLMSGKRLPKPDSLSIEIYSLMERCWLKKPEQRPDFSEIVKLLERLTERKMYITFENFISSSNPTTPTVAPEAGTSAAANGLLLEEEETLMRI